MPNAFPTRRSAVLAGAAVVSRGTFTRPTGRSPADTDADDDDCTPNQGDCNDADDSINPDADEVDNDGIDQDCDGEDGGLNVQQVGISGSDSNLVVGRSRTYTAQALLADGRVIDITALATFDTTDSAVATFDGNRLTALTPGAFDATASFAGKTAVKDLTAIAGIAADEIAPIAEITSPAPGEEIATELTVTGIATDANLTGWPVSVIHATQVGKHA